MPGEAWRTSVAWRLLLRALIAAGYLFACRLLIVYQARTPGEPPGAQLLLDALARFGMDALAVATLTAAALAVARLSASAGSILMTAGSAALMLLGGVNVHVVRLYRQPATVNLLDYGNFFGIDGLRSFADYVTATDVVLVAGAVAGLASFALAGRVQRSRAFAWPSTRRAILAASLAMLVALPLYGLLRDDEDLRRHHANAGWWLAKSALTPAPKLPEIGEPDLHDPFETFAIAPESRITTPERRRRAGIRNVVVIVLESVGSEYLDLTRNPGLTPNLARLRTQSAYFPNTYAAMPSSPASLFSLMTGMYPPVAPEAIPMREPAFPATTLVEQLSAGGRRSAVFSTTWGFLDFTGYLGERGAERVEELAPRASCGAPTTDDCTFAAMKRWIARSDEAFFALLWTYGAHYPYGLDPAVAARPGPARERYLAAIAESDRQVGELVGWLDRQGKLDETLVVLVGDHGQSFFQHGYLVHGNDVYRETIRVPLILVNRRLFAGTTDVTPVRMIDVAPTVLSLAGEQVPATMQGLDLSGPLRPRRVFYAAAWLNYVLGFEEGGMKYNYFPGTGELEAFDLRRDPGEQTDLGLQIDAERRAAIVRRIANWKAAVEAKTAAARSAGASR